MIARHTSPVLALAALVPALLLAGCSGDDEPDQDPGPPVSAPREPAPVEIAVDTGTPTPPEIGVLLAVSTEPGQGQDVLPAAQGAQVAAYRLGLDGGTAPDLVVEVDDGTPQGASAAMAALVDAGVAGVVVASTGDHLARAVDEAADAGVAVLLPYWRPSSDIAEGVWVTGPSTGAVEQRMQDALASEGLEQTFVVTGEGVRADGVTSAESSTFRGNDPARLIDRIGRLAESDRIDSVVIGTSAPTQARIVTLLQGAQPDLPILLTPEALSPVFAEALEAQGGTTAGRLTTVGADAGDATTLTQSVRADSAASYFAALRLAAGDPDATDLLDERPMSEVADGADIASHDAVVALTRAVAEAGSSDPEAVRDALAGLALDSADGLAGPPLDFGANPTMPAEDVVVLQGTSQDPGVRPEPAGLYWFAVPAGGRDGAG